MTPELTEHEKIILKLKNSKETISILKTLFDNRYSKNDLKNILELDKDTLDKSISFLKKNDLIYKASFHEEAEYGLKSTAILIMVFDLNLKF